MDLITAIKSLQKIKDLAFKGGMSKTEFELRDWNMRIHQEASRTLELYEEEINAG